MENINLLDEVYLPQIEKEGFRKSKAFKLLDDKGLDISTTRLRREIINTSYF